MIETKFKDSELGQIPEDWEVKSVKDFSNIVTGATPSTDNPNYWGGNIRWMSSGELNNKIIYDVIGRITQDGYNSASTHMLPVDCVLIGLAGQGKTRGTAAINKVPLCTNQSIGAILPCNTVNPHYLYHFIDNQYLNLRALSSGDGGRGGLSKTLLLNFKIILSPHISEQERIAEALNDVDALIKELDALIEKKRMVLKATMQDLLTGRRRLPGFSEPWQEDIIDNVCSVTTGASNSQDQVANGRFPFYIRSSSIVYSEKFLFDCEGVITIGDGQIGKVFHYVNGKFDLHQRCYLMYNFKGIDAKFFYYIFSTFFYDRVISLSAKATVDSVRRSMITKMKIFVPYSLSEQRAIAEILSDMDAEIEELEKKKEKYTSIRQGMMQQLLTGKIRLI